MTVLGVHEMLRSQVCTQQAMESPEFREIAAILDPTRYIETHRKLWEWCFIAEALRQDGALRIGNNGLGFAVGTEPLVSYFASFGPDILATDLGGPEAAEKGWIETGQHAEGRLSNHFCTSPRFAKAVEYRSVDMTSIPADLAGKFSFVWSACALEHLGTIEAGLEFVLKSLDCLDKEGIAVHTTEFNISSDTDTVEEGPTVIYRRRDIELLQKRARQRGWIIDLDWSFGSMPLDYHVDFPPYSKDNHLKLRLFDHTCTSIGLILKHKDRATRLPVSHDSRLFAL